MPCKISALDTGDTNGEIRMNAYIQFYPTQTKIRYNTINSSFTYIHDSEMVSTGYVNVMFFGKQNM